MMTLNQRELDNQLFIEFQKNSPNENNILELITKGANIDSLDEGGDTLLIKAIIYTQDGLDSKFIQFLIDLGVDVNYEDEDGFNCLFYAALTQKPELVEMLLKAGANPNCVCKNPLESLLDWAEFDQWYEEKKPHGGGKPMSEIVQLLKRYGAKNYSELSSKKK